MKTVLLLITMVKLAFEAAGWEVLVDIDRCFRQISEIPIVNLPEFSHKKGRLLKRPL